MKLLNSLLIATLSICVLAKIAGLLAALHERKRFGSFDDDSD